MKGRNVYRGAALAFASLFVGFSAAHLIDEVRFGAPAEFHLSVEATQALAFVFIAALTGLVVRAAAGSRGGYRGLILLGLLIAAADLLKHGPEIAAPGPWRSGLVSESLSIGVVVAGLLTAASSWLVLRSEAGAVPAPTTDR